MAEKPDTGRTKNFDDQMDRLAGDLREQGVAPERDLWGDIDQAISAAESNLIRPARRRRWDWPQIAATAAMVTFLVGAGWWGQQQRAGHTGPPALATDLTVTSNPASGLDVITQALTELNQAMAGDPDNKSLANLALMLHQSRGRMLRQNPEMRLNGS